MRIAQIAPLYEAVPPKLYGGTERVVSYLTEALVELGHDVTLFASGDSVTSARLEAAWPRALRLDPSIRDSMAPHMRLLEQVARVAHEFDVLHFHLDYLPFPLMSRLDTPYVTTLHGRLDLPELQPVFDAFPDAPVVSISNSQRKPLPLAAWAGTVYHGLPETLLTPQPDVKPRISGVPRPDLPGKARRHGDPDRRAKRVAAEDRRESRQGRRRLLQGSDRAAARRSARRVHRRDQRGAEAGVPVGREGAAVPDRLAGAVRPRDDRGDGVRHAGRRIQSRLRAGSDRGRRDGLHRRGRARRRRRAAPDRQPVARCDSRALRLAFQCEGDGAALRRDLRVALRDGPAAGIAPRRGRV
ncbi:Glycosyl transferase, partial [Burkholderia dolosa AU0158]